jgi:phage terminase large subunit
VTRAFNIFGANAEAFNDTASPEVLLAGAAGTGKSLAVLAKILAVSELFPGCRTLICRKTRESLTESVLVTWERDVLGPDHPVLTTRPTLRRVRQSYQFANGSVVVVGGMDKPDKVLSSEWDLIYCPEMLDLDLVDWETLAGRLRNGRVPWQQIIGDCNPGSPHSWQFKRQATGSLKMYTSTHDQNPRYFDRARRCWTPAGEQYLARLERMTGARRDRFLKGLWVAAEGAVYDYDPAVHLKPRDWRPPAGWVRVWAIDWGKTSPTALGVYAVDPATGVMVHVREVYKTRLRPAVLGRRCAEWISSGEEPTPAAVVCDHDTGNDGYQEEFERESGLSLQLADKADRRKGIEQVQERFDHAPGCPPRLYFREGARDHDPDRYLVDAGRPTCALDELTGYVWDPDMLKDEPIADNDHALDNLRYAVRYIDAHYGPGTADRFGYPRGEAARPYPAYLDD